jgi:predicted alpha-1,2-mannosidase
MPSLDRLDDHSGVAAIKAKGKRQKAKGKSTEERFFSRTFAFCPLPFAFCLDRRVAVSIGAALLTSATSLGCGHSPSPTTNPPPADPPPVETTATDVAASVDPFIGTGDSDAPSPVMNGSGGSTYPGAALPFGMVQWSPDTPMATPAGYHFGDGVLTGFSLTHLSGAGCNAKRDFPVFPVLGDAWNGSSEPSDTFTLEDEIASAGFYEVTLGSGIKVDLTATQRTGLARFTFPAGASGKVLVSGGWSGDVLQVHGFEASVGADGTITGHRTNSFFCATASSYVTYFAARFDRTPTELGTWSGGSMQPGATSVSGERAGVYASFDTSSEHVVHLKVGLSYVSEANAVANLEAENTGWDFDVVHEAAVAAWNGYLGRIRVEGGTDDARKMFYTALYHALLQPGVASDVDGSFTALDGTTKTAPMGHARYADFSNWDIYRSWVQLAAVVAPDETSDMMQTMVDSAGECGALPQWALESTETAVMVGDPADPLLASAYAFGARGFDTKAALAAMVKDATDPTAACNGFLARKGLAAYLARGYCPSDDPNAPRGPASTTLEYALDDFAIAQFAGALGDNATKATFLGRAKNWANVFDPRAHDSTDELFRRGTRASPFTGFPEPRLTQDEDGVPAFQLVDVGQTVDAFVEGNASQYTFLVPHDVPGLIAALGGDQQAIVRLDSLFALVNAGLNEPHFYMGNEPGFATPWQYPWAGAPWRTQAVVHRILARAYGTGSGGLPGNDDLGAMSSWQVWAMLGLYPEVPGVGGLVLGSPSFTKATITLAGGKTLVITARNAAADTQYVQSLSVNGTPTTSTWLAWSSVARGGRLDFTLGKTQSMWGSGPADRPPSFF